MGFFDKFTHSKELQKAIDSYNNKVNYCINAASSIETKSIKLYNLRKDCYRQMQELHSLINALDDAPEILKKGSSRAIRYADNIKQAWDFETSNKKSYQDSNWGTAIGSGVAVGGAIAMGGPAAAMALATTFGTASTGAAISSLGGAAAANAALAWLGGGAVAAGGGGIAAGSAILGMMGPLGWGIAGVAGIASLVHSSFQRAKNDEKIAEIKSLEKELNGKCSELRYMSKSLDLILVKTIELQRQLDLSGFKIHKSYNESVDFQKQLFSIVDISKKLGKLSKESITIKHSNNG